MSSNFTKIRDILVSEIEFDIVGPRDPEEQLRISPTGKYLSGVLYPKNIQLQTEEIEVQDSNTKDDVQSDTHKIDLDNNQGSVPSSMGMSCNVSLGAEEILLEVSYGKYFQEKLQGDKKTYPPWKRKPFFYTEIIKLSEGKFIKNYDDKTVELRYIIKKLDKSYFVSVFLTNLETPSIGKVEPAKCIFQPILKLQAKNRTDKIFVDITSKEYSEESGDRKQFDLLFNHRKQFGIGHSCSVEWNSNNVIDNSTDWIKTTFVPKHEVPNIRPYDSPEIKKKGTLDMKKLSEVQNPIQYQELLEPIVKEYDAWINSMESTIGNLDQQYRELAQYQIKQCKEASSRINSGIKLISTNNEIADAFRFTNQVMLYQRSYGEWAKINKQLGKPQGKKPEKLGGTWYLFQLAFILLNIESISDPQSKYRKYADLLWFPTGGGKTEAYLGIIAFTMGLRRLRKKAFFKYGVTVMMRYTLRLLTIQQFHRAATFMCACEIIRNTTHLDGGKRKWGDEPFRVGLWVGQKTTPNELDDPQEGAKAQIYKLRNSIPVTESNPYQIQSCPWCGSEITPWNYDFTDKTKQIEQMQIFCSNDNCEFSKKNNQAGLPVLLIDSDIYKLAPSLIIATVDKYAQISKKWQTAVLFGKANKYSEKEGFITTNDPKPHTGHQGGKKIYNFSEYGQTELDPPELIIQDELHLIAGPLGTLTGLYETAIDYLCSHNGNVPKIIASTATIRRAEEQIRSLFNRNCVIFPPQGFSFGNSFFAEEKPTDIDPGRLYVGTCATSRAGLTILARVAAVILQTIRQLRADNKFTDAELDPYYTLVSYFNSIKELAGANRVFDDSVPDFMWNIEKKYDVDETQEIEESVKDEPKTKNVPKKSNRLDHVELTSRIDASEIPKLLEHLNISLTNKEGIRPYDALLCTNMIQVGVDIDRFGVMMINGQPKNTSEYIQASGRIGRRYPGLIVTTYNFLKPRDLSHYENFIYYHSTYHKNVEPVSLTPFSARARDRGLFGVIVSLFRLQDSLLAKRSAAGNFGRTNPRFAGLISSIINVFQNRVSEIELEEWSGTKSDLDSALDYWDKVAKQYGSSLQYDKNPNQFASRNNNGFNLMESSIYTDSESKFVPNSLREAEEEVNLYYHSKSKKGESNE